MSNHHTTPHFASSSPMMPDGADLVGPRRALPAGMIARHVDELSAIQRAVAVQRIGAGDNIARIASQIGTTKAVLEELSAEADIAEAIGAEHEVMTFDDAAFDGHTKKLLRQGLESALIERKTSTVNLVLRLSAMLSGIGRRDEEDDPIDRQRRRHLLYLDSLGGDQLGDYLWAGTRLRDEDGRRLRKAGPPPAHFLESLFDPSIVPDSFDPDAIDGAGQPVPPPAGFVRHGRNPLDLPGQNGYLDDQPALSSRRPVPTPDPTADNDNGLPHRTAQATPEAPPPPTAAPADTACSGQQAPQSDRPAAPGARATSQPVVVHAREPRPTWLRQNGNGRRQDP